MKLDFTTFVRWLMTFVIVATAHFAIVCCVIFAFMFASGMADPKSDSAPAANPVLDTFGAMLIFPLGLLAPPGSAWKVLVAPLNSLFIGIVLGSFIAWRMQQSRKAKRGALLAAALFLAPHATAQVESIESAPDCAVDIYSRIGVDA